MSIRVAAGVVKRGELVAPETVIELNRTNFQGSFGQWKTPGNDDPRTAWKVTTSGGTPTSTTGAAGGSVVATRSVDSTNGMAFTEASESVTVSGPWSLESPVLDASEGTLTLGADIHMNFNNGAILDGTLIVQGWNGSAWSQIGNTITGSQQTAANAPWKALGTFGTYDSTGFTNADFKFRFLASRGASTRQFDYDFCVDNAVITGPASARPPRTQFDFDTGNRRLHVTQDDSDPEDGQTADLKFTTIQAALNVALPGDVITIADGRYYETLSLTNFQGTPAQPIWISAENRGEVTVTNSIQSVWEGDAVWQDEGSGIFSFPVATIPYAAWKGSDMLPLWTLADLQGSTFQALANAQTGAAAATFTKPDRGYAFQNGRVFVKLPDASNPTGQKVGITNGTAKTLFTLSSSPYVIIDGIVFESSGNTYAVNTTSGSIVTTVRNCIFKACRHGVRCGSDFTLIEYPEFAGVPGMTAFGQDLRTLATAGSDVHERYHVDYAFGQKFAFNTDRNAPIYDSSVDIPSSPATRRTVVTKGLFFDAFAISRIAQHLEAEFKENVAIGILGPAVKTAAAGNEQTGDLHINDNRFLDCQKPFLHSGSSKYKRHLMYRNLVLNFDFDVARPPFLIEVSQLAAGAEIHYYQNTIINRIGAADDYGTFGTGHRLWSNSGQNDRILTWQNNIVSQENDLDVAAVDPLAAGRKNNVVVSPADNTQSQAVQGTSGVFAGTTEADLILDPTYFPDDGTRLGLGTSPAIGAGAALAATLPDSAVGATANDDAGALFSFTQNEGDNFPRLSEREFNLDAPSRWTFPGNVVTPPPPPPQPTPDPTPSSSALTKLQGLATHRDKVTGRPFATFYEASVGALGGSPESSGLVDLEVQYQGAYLPGISGRQGNPDRTRPTVSRIQANVAGANSLFVPDIEGWYPTPGAGTGSFGASAIANYEFVGSEINKVKGSKIWGWYSTIPQRTLFGVEGFGSTAQNTSWKASNTEMIGMAAQVDVMCPSVYAFDSIFGAADAAARTKFTAYVRGNVAEAKRISGNKPVIAFLWTSFHNIEFKFIPSAFVAHMAEACLDAGCDGVDFWQTSAQRRSSFAQQNIWFQGWLQFRNKRLEEIP
ncbi:MAG: hypothetical protein R3F54_28660 [Alphaproteobacteria bacterium]